MKTRSPHRGYTLIQVLIGFVITAVVGTAFLALVQITYRWEQTSIGQNSANSSARTVLDTLVDNIRTAQNQQSPGTGFPAGCFVAAGASSLTLYQAYYNYSDSPPAEVWYTVQFSLNASNVLQQTTVLNGVTTTIPIALGVTSLTFTYYVSTGAYTPASSSWTTTANPNSPTSLELPNVGAVQVNTTVTTWDGFARTMTGMVRLMNNPYQAIQ